MCLKFLHFNPGYKQYQHDQRTCININAFRIINPYYVIAQKKCYLFLWHIAAVHQIFWHCSLFIAILKREYFYK